jgi:hypothetical protein
MLSLFIDYFLIITDNLDNMKTPKPPRKNNDLVCILRSFFLFKDVGGVWCLVVELLPSMHEDLDSIPSTAVGRKIQRRLEVQLSGRVST